MSILVKHLVEINEHWKDGVLYSLSYNGVPVCLECGMTKTVARKGNPCLILYRDKHMWVNSKKIEEVTMQKTAV